MTENLPAPRAARQAARADLIAILGVLALVAAVLLIPATRGFIFTTVGTVFGAIAHAGYVVGGVIADINDAAGFVRSIFGGAA